MANFIVDYISEEELTTTEYEAYMDAKEEKLMEDWDEHLDKLYRYEQARGEYEKAESAYRRFGGEYDRRASDYWYNVMKDLEKEVA